MNKVSPIFIPSVPPIRNSFKSIFIDTETDTCVRKRTTNTPSPSLSPPLSPQIFIKPPPPTPIPTPTPNPILEDEKKYVITIANDNDKEHCMVERNSYKKQKDTNTFDINGNMDMEVYEQIIHKLRKSPKINLRYDRMNVHDYIYNYILFAYNFYNPIFTMYVTIISYKQMTQTSSIFKNVVISYAIIYPLIAMLILLNEAYYIYCKKFIYYKLMDNGVIFKWKKEQLYKSFYFWWYIISLIFICIGINDSLNVILMFINQTSNLCIYIYNTINIDSTLITLNGFFENNVNIQMENIQKIVWIDEDKLKENVYSMIEAKHIIQKNINKEIQLLMSSFLKKDDHDNNDNNNNNNNYNDNDNDDDTNILIMENFDKYKHLLNTKTIKEYYNILQKCYNTDIDIIGKIDLKRNKDYVSSISHEHTCHTKFPFYKRKWVLTLLNEMKKNSNLYWNHKCIHCDLLKETNYYLCLICNTHLCNDCNILNTKKSLKWCYNSSDMDHKTILVYNNYNNKFINKENKVEYPFCYKLYNHYIMDNIQIISVLDTIYYLSILSILMIEFYGFYIIFS